MKRTLHLYTRKKQLYDEEELVMFNELFGPSIRLLVLDCFLENPEKLMNLREVARMVGKNPGSISRVMPRLLKEGFLEQHKVGKVTYAYRLNTENEVVRLLIDFRKKLQIYKSKAETNSASYQTVKVE